MIEFTPITERVQKLLDNLKSKAFTDRSDEWFREEDFEKAQKEVFKKIQKEQKKDFFSLSVIERKAHAIDIMLRSMTDREVNKHTPMKSKMVNSSSASCPWHPTGSEKFSRTT